MAVKKRGEQLGTVNKEHTSEQMPHSNKKNTLCLTPDLWLKLGALPLNISEPGSVLFPISQNNVVHSYLCLPILFKGVYLETRPPFTCAAEHCMSANDVGLRGQNKLVIKESKAL
jgi:hypothetical protein